MKKKNFYNAFSNRAIIDEIKNWGFINLVFLVLSIFFVVIFKMDLDYLNVKSFKFYIAIAACILIAIDLIIGFIVGKFIKTKHKTLLLLLIVKYFMFVFAFFMTVLIVNFSEFNDMKIHMIIFIISNIIFIPINIKSLKSEKDLKESKFSIIIGSLIPISGIIGMWVSRFFRSTGNDSLTPIMVFYVVTFIIIIMQKIFIILIWQYRNYEKVYTKELIDNWIRLEKKRGEDDPNRSYY